MPGIEQTKKQIADLQAIQKTHSPKSGAWQQASELLQPLFARMAELSKGQPI